VFFDNVAVKARTLIHAQNAIQAAHDPSDRAANDGSYRPGSPLAFSRTTFHASGHSLSRCRKWDDNSRRQKRRCENLAKHLEPPV
jgi:hypothetical protein